MRPVLLLLAILLAGCVSPRSSGVKVIVGAKLIPGPGREPIQYSVIVIDGDKFGDVGPQQTTPVPKGAEMIRGIGSTVEPMPGGGPIERGQAADLVLKGTAEKIMRGGQWIN
jgi:hypothetical protein